MARKPRKKRILVTGAAGFIGSQVARSLLARGEEVVGIDNFSPYYDPILKFARLKPLKDDKGFTFIEGDIADREAMLGLAERHRGIDRIVHLAAQPGVRHSMVDPYIYVQTNVMGQLVMAELARRMPGLKHFVYASSSSVYGGNRKQPFAEEDRVDRPISLYAATKRADELLGETYAHLYKLKATGLRYMMMETVVYAREFLFVKEMYDKGELGRLQFLQASHQQDMEGWPGYWPGLPPMYYATHCVGPMLALTKIGRAHV
mgnify:CR=1 FL=1